MATEIRGARAERVAQVEAGLGREQKIETLGRRSESGKSDVAGRARKKALAPALKRDLAKGLPDRFGTSVRKPCAALKLSRTVYLYRATAKDSQVLVHRIKEIEQTRVNYGYRRVHVLLRREGFEDNHKRVYQLYREQGLSLRHKRPKRNKAAKLRQPKTTAQHANQMWSMDFVADNLFDGRKLGMLTVVNCFTRESSAITLGRA